MISAQFSILLYKSKKQTIYWSRQLLHNLLHLAAVKWIFPVFEGSFTTTTIVLGGIVFTLLLQSGWYYKPIISETKYLSTSLSVYWALHFGEKTVHFENTDKLSRIVSKIKKSYCIKCLGLETISQWEITRFLFFPWPWVNVTERLLIGKICHIKILQTFISRNKKWHKVTNYYIFSFIYRIKETQLFVICKN